MNMEKPKTTATRVNQNNLPGVCASMRQRHDLMLKWSRENSNDLGGMFGQFQKAMGDTDVPQEIETYFGALVGYGEVFYVEERTFIADNSELPYSTVRRKERNPKAMLERFKGYLKEGRKLYIHSITLQPAYEVFGFKTESFLVTEFAHSRSKI